MPAKPFMMRNRQIVLQSERLIGCPDAAQTVRSGTWATIRIAHRAGAPVMVIHPDGRTEQGGLWT